MEWTVVFVVVNFMDTKIGIIANNDNHLRKKNPKSASEQGKLEM